MRYSESGASSRLFQSASGPVLPSALGSRAGVSVQWTREVRLRRKQTCSSRNSSESLQTAEDLDELLRRRVRDLRGRPRRRTDPAIVTSSIRWT